jgi:nucleoside-diphosphate-sugar epimerase
LGGAIVRQLVERGETVRSFSRHHHGKLEALGIEQRHGDVADFEAVREACRGVETVFHVAARPGVWGSYESYYRPNVIGTKNVIEACRAEGVSRLIHTSSPSVVFDGGHMEGVNESVPYPDKYHAPYPETKAIAEKEVSRAASEGLPAVILRPHLIWGPEDNHLVPRILARGKRLARVGQGDNLVDTIYIDNAADAHLLAADRLAEDPTLSGRIYFISQGEPMPLWYMVDAILAAGGQPPVRRQVSHKTARRLGAFFEFFYRLFRIQSDPPMTRFVADELATAHWFDISAARRDLGYEPGVSTEEGLERLGEWLEGSGNVRKGG